MNQPEPVQLNIVEQSIAEDVERCDEAQRQLFARIRISPETIMCDRDGKSGPVWTVCRIGDRVIWYEDIHEAFEIHSPDSDGVLRPESFGMFELKQILYILLKESE